MVYFTVLISKIVREQTNSCFVNFGRG